MILWSFLIVSPALYEAAAAMYTAASDFMQILSTHDMRVHIFSLAVGTQLINAQTQVLFITLRLFF